MIIFIPDLHVNEKFYYQLCADAKLELSFKLSVSISLKSERFSLGDPYLACKASRRFDIEL